MRQILISNGYSEVETEESITKCLHYNYLNDQVYVDSFIHDKQTIQRWGKLKIIRELNRRGINDIGDDLFDRDLEQSNLNRHLEIKLAKIKLKDQNVMHLKQQLYRYLYFKGFESELIHNALDRVLNN
ncbi:MAG: RecX family transcriptional regulator [Calditrichaeota bacterium]|nr:RecX family transcriptional regulator [Calditrichota bacterium]